MSRLWTLASCVAFLVNCTGYVTGGEQAPAGTGTGLPATGRLGGPATVTNPVAPADTVFQEAYDRGARPESLRRLSSTEYFSTLSTAFPGLALPALELPQDGSLSGYARAPDSSITDTSLNQYLEAAKTVAAALASNLPVGLGACSPASVGMRSCVEQLIDTRLPRLFRKPVDSALRASLLALFDQAKQIFQASDSEALELTIVRALQSPRFLYQVELGAPAPELGQGMLRLDDYEIAARLSYGLLRSAPDDALFEAAAHGQLVTGTGLSEQVQRLLKSPQGQGALWEFHRQWLLINRLQNVTRSADRFPDFTLALASAMEAETAAFVATVTSQGNGAFRALLTLQTEPHRAGILGQASFLTANASEHDDRRRIFRGKVVRTRLLCTDLPSPPPSAATTPVEDRLSDARCASCHNLMDPIGVGFDGFDAVGRWVGAANLQGSLGASGPVSGDFTGNEQLSERLVSSPYVQGCYLQNWIKFTLGREVHAPDAAALEQLHDAFGTDLDVVALVARLVQSDVFHDRYSPGVGCAAP